MTDEPSGFLKTDRSMTRADAAALKRRWMNLEGRTIDALRILLRRKGVTASVSEDKATIWFSPEKGNAETFVQALEAAAERTAALALPRPLRRYVVGSVGHTGGGVDIPLSVGTTPYELRDAIEACRAKDERHRRIWPDTNVEHHVYWLERVPSYVEQADLTSTVERSAEESAAFDEYLASSEALGQDPCTCGHSGNLHLHGPESWGECDAEDCDCEMYCSIIDARALDVGTWWQ